MTAMDEPKIKDLLDTAGREYSQGKYAEAIARWKQVLTLDRANQKAKEGIRMARLLVVNWEAAESDSGGEGAVLLTTESADAATQEKIEVGIARVRELMAAGRHQEAFEGCQLLAELAPGVASVSDLLEELAQVREAQPFVKERLERASKFLAQGKSKEAAEEARNVLSVDKTNLRAKEILDRATGGGIDPKPKMPSAFQVDGAGKAPPSPFSGRAAKDTDALLAQFEFEPTAQARTAPADPPAAAKDESALPLDLELPSRGDRGVGGGPGVDASIRSLIEEGEGLFAKKKYQAAIEVWSRIYALDRTHGQAGVLIDRAKAVLEDLSRQVDEAYFRGVDALESGNLDEAKRSLREVLATHPDHPDARRYLEQAEGRSGRPSAKKGVASAPPATVSGAPPIPAPPTSSPLPSRTAGPQPSPLPPPSRAGQEAAVLDSASVPLAISSDQHPRTAPKTPKEHASQPSVSPGVMKRKPVQPVSTGPRPAAIGGGLIALVLLLAAGWFFFLRGRSEPAAAGPAAPAAPAPAAPTPAEPAETRGIAAQSASHASRGTLEVRPGTAPSSAALAIAEAAATKKKIDDLMKEGRGLVRDERFAEAVTVFEQVIALDPTVPDAVDLKSKAAAEAQKTAKFNRELEAAKAAFTDGDWASSLYKLYRLREAHKEIEVLPLYIRNANYNWGIEALSGFEVDNAIEHFKDALEMAPGDPGIQRNLDFAARYRRHGRDAAFNSFVKSLSPKNLDDR